MVKPFLTAGSARPDATGGVLGNSGRSVPGEGPVRVAGSLGARLTLALVGISVFTLVAVGVLFYGFISRYVLEREQERMLSHAVKIAGQVENLIAELSEMSGPSGGRALRMLLRVDLQVLPAGSTIMVFSNGSLVAVAGPANIMLQEYQRLYPRAATLAENGAAARVMAVEEMGTTMVVAAAPFSFGSDRGLVMMTLPVGDAVASRRGLVGVLLVSGVVAVVLAIILGLGLGNWIARPLRRLSRAARVMAGGSYSESVTGAYPGEVFELADSLETMRQEVKRSEDSLRGFVSSAAHELRTPLTSIAGFSQALLDGTAATPEEHRRSAAAIHRESTRLQRLVDTLLILSRYDSRQYRPHLQPVDVTHLVADEIQLLADAGMAEPSRILLEGDATASAVTDAVMLRQAVANLLHNAVQYGGDEPVAVTVRAGGGRVQIIVSNGGAPIPMDERARIFDRFYRGRASARVGGFGLGLPLVKEICAALGGEVALAPDPTRTVFVIDLPAGAPTVAAPDVV